MNNLKIEHTAVILDLTLNPAIDKDASLEAPVRHRSAASLPKTNSRNNRSFRLVRQTVTTVHFGLDGHCWLGLTPVAGAGGTDGIDLDDIQDSGSQAPEGRAGGGGLRGLQDHRRCVRAGQTPVIRRGTEHRLGRGVQLTGARAEGQRDIGRCRQHADGEALRFLDGETAAEQHVQVPLQAT